MFIQRSGRYSVDCDLTGSQIDTPNIYSRLRRSGNTAPYLFELNIL
ncbi:MAG: hypothetical protein RBU23_00305 [Candidatus Auribacterota bacterium]|nr:hypothetical protein [Candidatus Auribacterota bacterium]